MGLLSIRSSAHHFNSYDIMTWQCNYYTVPVTVITYVNAELDGKLKLLHA